MNPELIHAIEQKYISIGENPETYLKGLLETRQINYWDYIETDTLLSLQRPRTDYPDEEIFIMYHQVTELVLKLMTHELKQISGEQNPDAETLISKLKRLNRYTGLLINSFDIMREGIDYTQYNTFRTALTPASGFQSAQFRFIEIQATPLINLIQEEKRNQLTQDADIPAYFELIYWKDAGLDRKTGRKSLTLQQFEQKYQDALIQLAGKMQNKTLADKIEGTELMQNEEVRKEARNFDRMYNIDWPNTHLKTARHFLNSKGENTAATGGSEWQKYLHPAFQRRKFFPFLWSETELQNWGQS